MRRNKWLFGLPVIATLAGLGAGFLLGPVHPAAPEPEAEAVVHAQAAGGLGAVLPPMDQTTFEVQVDPNEAAALRRAATARMARIATSDPGRYQLMQHRAQQAQPLVNGLQQNPDLLVQMMQKVRDDPALRQDALNRIRNSGGATGLAGNAVGDEMLQQTLDRLLADPERLNGVLGMVGSNPQLMQTMLGGMGLEGVSQGEISRVMGQLESNPEMLGGLMSGDRGTIDQLANTAAGGGMGGPVGGFGPATGAPMGQDGLALDLGTLMQMVDQQQRTGAGGMSLGAAGLDAAMGGMGDPSMAMGGMGGADLGAMLGGSGMGSDMLGAGATMSMLADMVGVFGGGAQAGDLQSMLRNGDIDALMAMVHTIYGPNGSLSDQLGVEVNSYTDLLNTLIDDDY